MNDKGQRTKAEGRETLGDIVADYRKRADALEKALGDQHSYVERCRNLAERLEAAADDAEAAQLENDRLRSLVKRLADMVDSHEVWHPTGGELLLLAEAREAIGEGGAE